MGSNQRQAGSGDRTSVLVRGGRSPLWEQLLTDLCRRLERGEFSVSFPGELELAADYQVSRHTVRQALRRLREDGVVTAERGRRPRLAERVEISQPLGALYSLFASVEQAGLSQDSEVRVLEMRFDEVIAGRLGLPGTAPLVYLERVRLAGGAPLALDRVWLPGDVCAPLLDADFSHVALYDVLADRCGVRLTGGSEQVHAIVPGRDDRAVLGIDTNVGAFAIDRLGCASSQPVEWRHTLVRGDRFSLSTTSSATTGYHVDVAGHTRIPDDACLSDDRPG